MKNEKKRHYSVQTDIHSVAIIIVKFIVTQRSCLSYLLENPQERSEYLHT